MLQSPFEWINSHHLHHRPADHSSWSQGWEYRNRVLLRRDSAKSATCPWLFHLCCQMIDHGLASSPLSGLLLPNVRSFHRSKSMRACIHRATSLPFCPRSYVHCSIEPDAFNLSKDRSIVCDLLSCTVA